MNTDDSPALKKALSKLSEIQAALDALRLDIQDNAQQLQAQSQTIPSTTSQD